MGTPFKMKGSPMARNFGISPVKDKNKLHSRAVDKDGNKLYGSKKKDAVGEDKYQNKGAGNEGGLVKVLDYGNQRKSSEPKGNFKGISFDTWSDAKKRSKKK